MSQRKSGRSQQEVAFDSSLLQDAVKECVRFIVCREGGKVPIKRAEIHKHLSCMCEISNPQTNAVISEAIRILKRIYGYDLKKIVAKEMSYVVVLTAECGSQPSTVTDANHRRMLVAALIHIYMTGGPVKEDDMWKFLDEAGLLKENDFAGRKILTSTFTRQLYLQYSKVGEGDLTRHVFEWGQRAIYEVPKLFLLNKMSQAFEKSPDHWCEQYKEATAQNENNAI